MERLEGHDLADMERHTDEDLRQGIETAKEQEPRVRAEKSEEAVRKQQEQLQAMKQELGERGEQA